MVHTRPPAPRRAPEQTSAAGSCAGAERPEQTSVAGSCRRSATIREPAFASQCSDGSALSAGCAGSEYVAQTYQAVRASSRALPVGFSADAPMRRRPPGGSRRGRRHSCSPGRGPLAGATASVAAGANEGGGKTLVRLLRARAAPALQLAVWPSGFAEYKSWAVGGERHTSPICSALLGALGGAAQRLRASGHRGDLQHGAAERRT